MAGTRHKRNAIAIVALALPATYFLLTFALPVANLIRMAFAKPVPRRVLGEGWTFANFTEILSTPLYMDALWVTLRIGFVVALVTLLIGYPCAIFLSRLQSKWRGALLFILLASLLISIVVRAYGWIVLLSNRGLVNSALMQLGIIDRPLRLIFNETGVVIGTVHVMLPFMVLAILGSLQTLDSALDDAAASLGARPSRVFLDVVLPLSLPGAAAGFLLVFLLSVCSFITPVLLGGQLVLTLPVLAILQFSTAFNWALGSALITVLLVSVLAITFIYDRAVEPLVRRGVA